MAHSYWGLPEIVRAIAANLVSDKAKGSAVALASCCKSLEEPALGEVWRSLSNLAPLVTCYPLEIWDFEVVENLVYFNFKRAPLYAEWTRFQQQYASKVRHLKIASESKVSSSALHLLRQLSDHSPLLPNVLSLSWECDQEFIPFVSLFISRSLTSIEIKAPVKAATILPPILRRLSTISPYIKEIRVQIKDMHHDLSMVEASSQLLMHCNINGLRKYNVDAAISSSALRHAIQLPSLDSFWLISDSSINQLTFPLPDVVFPSLRVLSVKHNDGDHTWLDLLPAIESPVFSRISVHCPGPDVVPFMEKFELTVTGCGLHERLESFKLLSRDYVKITTPDIIAHTFRFKKLTELHLLGTCSEFCLTSDLTDDDIDLLTKALPCLESLKLGGKPCRFPSMITFKGLSTISRRCTRLKTLQIHFSTTSLIRAVRNQALAQVRDVRVALGLNGIPSSELCLITTIDVGSSRWNYGEPQNPASTMLALGLLGIFPHLENIVSKGPFSWEIVDEVIKASQSLFRVLQHNK